MDSAAVTPGTPYSTPATPGSVLPTPTFPGDGGEEDDSPPTSALKLSDSVTDYYRIVIMADSPVDNSEILTGFSNPNYTLSNDDALNSNELPPHTQYYSDDSDLYENIMAADTNNAHSEATRGGPTVGGTQKPSVGGGGTSASQSLDSLSAATYDSVASPADSEGHFSMTSSCVTSPAGALSPSNERGAGLVAVEHKPEVTAKDEEEEGESQGGGGGGFTGFYAIAHESRGALHAVAGRKEGEEVEDEEEGERKPLLKEAERVQR